MLKEQFSNELKLYGILSSAFAIFKKYAMEILIINLVCIAPMLILICYFLNFSHNEVSLFYKKLSLMLVAIAFEFFPIIAYVLIAELESGKELPEKPTIAQTLKATLPRWGYAVSASALAIFPILAGVFLLVIQGIIAMVYFSFVLQVAVLRGMTGISAIEYSCKLVDGRWYKMFGFVVVLSLPNWIISIWGYADSLQSGIPFSSQGYIFVCAVFILGGLFNAFSKIAMTLTFLNLEAVKAKSY